MATVDYATSYAAIFKAEKQDDGSLMVYGKATDDAIDSDNQICDAGWLNKAMPEWFRTGGNIREQHSNIAAGVAKELDSKADGHYITAHVVDNQSVKKVEAGVLKGFSIGIRAPRIVRDTKAANGRIIDGQIVEVSLVDRPANPNAKLMLAKSDGTEVIQVEEMVEQELPVVEDSNVVNVVEPVIETPATEEVVETPADTVEEKSAEPVFADTEKRAYGESAEEETAEGSSPNAAAEELSETKAEACSCDGCKSCKDSGGCDKSPCSKCMMAKADKCLECGCHKVDQSHGLSDVTTAEMVSPTDTPKSTITPLPTIERVGDVQDDEIYESEDSDKSAQTDDAYTAIIEKAVKSATETFRTEVEILKSSYSEEINKLQDELAVANSKAAKGGPMRSGKKAIEKNDFALLAAQYNAKAAATSDPLLSKGYREMADDFIAKSTQPAE